MTGNHESTKCQNNSESKQSIENIVGDILKRAKNILPLDRYQKFEAEARQSYEAFLQEKKCIKSNCCDNTIEFKEQLESKLQSQENIPKNKEVGQELRVGIATKDYKTYNDTYKATENFEQFISSSKSLKNYSNQDIGKLFSYVFAHSSADIGDKFK